MERVAPCGRGGYRRCCVSASLTHRS
jgi:hypothetical protein